MFYGGRDHGDTTSRRVPIAGVHYQQPVNSCETSAMAPSRQVSLIPYSTPCAFVERLDVAVVRPNPDALSLRYTLVGKRQRLRVPAPRCPARADELWRHTCFEAFLKIGGATEY